MTSTLPVENRETAADQAGMSKNIRAVHANRIRILAAYQPAMNERTRFRRPGDDHFIVNKLIRSLIVLLEALDHLAEPVETIASALHLAEEVARLLGLL